MIYIKEKNYEDAIHLMQIASQKYILNANYMLGYIYENGLGTPINTQKAFYNYKKSATVSNPKSEYKLCSLYYNGKGTIQDFEQAYISCSLAASLGNIKSAALRDKIINYLTPSQLKKAQKISRLRLKLGTINKQRFFIDYKKSLQIPSDYI